MRASKFGYSVFISVALLIQSCGDGTSDSGLSSAVYGSCSLLNGKVCMDFVGSAFASNAEQTCTGQGGDYSSSGGCTTDSRVGSCIVQQGSPTEIIEHFYTSFNFTAEDIKNMCEQSGMIFVPA